MAEQTALVVDHGGIVVCLWVSTPPIAGTSWIRVVMLEALLPYWVNERMRRASRGL